MFIENTNTDNIIQNPTLTPQYITVPINCTQETDLVSANNNSTLDETLDRTLSPASTDTTNDSCGLDRVTDDETYYPSTSDNVSNESFSRNITLRPRRQHNVQGNNFMCHFQFNSVLDPQSVEEALSSANAKDWRRAMDEEYQSLLENNTWEITTLPSGKRSIPCKWVFKTKTNEKGEIIRYKARLVIKGCSQKPGIDYTEVYSPVVRYVSLRYLFALSVKYNLDICQMDAVSAFLQGDIEEEIYMTPPPMYESDGQVCKLKKSLYGLKQASRQWNKKLSCTLKDLGLIQSKLDPCIYFKIVDKNNMVFLAIYVDDIVLFTNSEETKKHIKNELLKKFKMKDLGNISCCIGIHVERDRKKGIIYLDQRKYIQEVLSKFGMSDCKPVKTPIDPNNSNFVQENSDENRILNDIPYKELIGCLLYISQVTRPDISFVINKLSKFNNKPEMIHWCALKRVLRYLKGSQDYRLCYKQNINETVMHGYCDADWASSVDDRRSCTGYTFMFQGGTISWNSRRQPTIALSTTEAEYMSLSSCVQEALWLKQFQECFWPQLKNQAMVIYSDNQSSIKLSGCNGYHSRSKHIDVRHHFVQEKVHEGAIDVQYIPTSLMVADALTKATQLSKHLYCLSKMGLYLREDVED